MHYKWFTKDYLCNIYLSLFLLAESWPPSCFAFVPSILPTPPPSLSRSSLGTYVMLLTKAGPLHPGRGRGEGWEDGCKVREKGKRWAEFQRAVLDDWPRQRHGNTAILLQGRPAIQRIWAHGRKSVGLRNRLMRWENGTFNSSLNQRGQASCIMSSDDKDHFARLPLLFLPFHFLTLHIKWISPGMC